MTLSHFSLHKCLATHILRWVYNMCQKSPLETKVEYVMWGCLGQLTEWPVHQSSYSAVLCWGCFMSLILSQDIQYHPGLFSLLTNYQLRHSLGSRQRHKDQRNNTNRKKQLLETHNMIYEVGTQQEMIHKLSYKRLKSKIQIGIFRYN